MKINSKWNDWNCRYSLNLSIGFRCGPQFWLRTLSILKVNPPDKTWSCHTFPRPFGRYLDSACYTRSSQKYKRQNESVRISLMILCYLPLNFYWRPEYIHSHRCQAIAILQWILASVSWSISIFLFNSQNLNLTQFSMSTFPPRNKVKNQFLICPMTWPNQLVTEWFIDLSFGLGVSIDKSS